MVTKPNLEKEVLITKTKNIINKTKNSLKKKMFFLIKKKLKSLKKILLNTNIQKQKKYKIKIK